MDIAKLQTLFSTAWVVWFFVLTVGIIIAVMRPGKRQYWQSCGDIPMRDDDAPAARARSI
jgi:cbb3-type cytochrome oxidase subunit 3